MEESELLWRRPPMATLSAAELNYLVFRYLHESGFTHSAFTLGYEAGINKSPIDGNLVPPGALITFVQKGLLYIELEANNESDGDEDFSFLQPLDLITKDTHELQRIIKEKKESIRKEKNKSKEKHKEYDQEPERARAREREKERQEREKEAEKERERAEKEKDKVKPEQPPPDSAKDRDDRAKDKSEGDAVSGGIKMETAVSSPAHCEIPSSDVTILEGHASEVFACAWCPTGSVIASGSGDSTARIWTIPDGPGSSTVQNGLQKPIVLKHYKGKTIEKCKDVTTLDWNFDGTLLATGSYDGMARIWTREGELRNTLNKHKGPVFSLKWNRKGDYLLSGSVDKTSIVWDVKTGEWKQHFEFHTAPTLDVDWRNNNSFATCSTDGMIHVCRIGENNPVKTFAGHKGEVNAIKWDPSGILLASCSDDITAKIWSIKQDKCLHDLKEHQKEIYTIRWSPTGPLTANPNQQLVLASASFDSSIKIWDVELGTVLQTLNGHSQAVYSIAFSPNGEYLASGSLDRYIHIWSMKEGKVVKTYKGDGGIFEVCWNKEGDKIAGCFSNNTVCVLNFRM